jgi:hypothetical protein
MLKQLQLYSFLCEFPLTHFAFHGKIPLGEDRKATFESDGTKLRPPAQGWRRRRGAPLRAARPANRASLLPWPPARQPDRRVVRRALDQGGPMSVFPALFVIFVPYIPSPSLQKVAPSCTQLQLVAPGCSYLQFQRGGGGGGLKSQISCIEFGNCSGRFR